MELFNPFYYGRAHYLSILFLIILVGAFISYYSANRLLNNNRSNFFIWLYAITFIVFVGFRPVSPAFGDMGTYNRMFSLFQGADIESIPSNDTLFFAFMYWCAQHMGSRWFFLIIEVLYVVPILIACFRFFRKNDYLAILVCFSAFSFFSYGVNGIRNGTACSFVLLALSLLEGSFWEKGLCLVSSLIAINFHHSTALPVTCMVVAYFVKSPKFFYSFWVFSILISLVAGNYVANIFADLGFDDRLSDYIMTEADEDVFSSTGFRWDFLLYSSVPIIFGYYFIFQKKVYDSSYLLLLGTYLLANAFWIMVIRANYSNRFAYLSWFLYPLVLVYPFLKFPIWPRTQGRKLSVLLIGHILFNIILLYAR